MKKIIKLLSGTLLTAAITLPASAQQLPNADFEGNWADCIPWTSKDNTKVQGTTPAPWTISNVVGINGTGATTVGSEVTGFSGGKAVKLVNTPNPYMASQIVPGYITLGTSWSTAEPNLFGTKINNADGGTFGGADFTFRPDAMSFKYMRKHGADSSQPATAVIYLWKGECSQTNVPGNITHPLMDKTMVKVTMKDRDAVILNKTCATGDNNPDKSNLTVIGTSEYTWTEENTEWKTMMLPINYTSSEKPEKINVIIAANDYFGSASNVKKDDEITIDDVKLVYYSRLESVKIGGNAVEGFSSDVYDYTMPVTFENRVTRDNAVEELSKTIEATLLSKAGTAKYETSVDGDAIVIKVTNDGEDVDGLKEHTYKFHYPYSISHTVHYPGTIDIYLNATTIEDVEPTFSLSDQEVLIDILDSEGLVHFRLPNFSLGEDMLIGDINVDFVSYTDGDTKTYKGSTDRMVIGGAIVADVAIDGVEDVDGKLVANIDVICYPEATPAPAASGARAAEAEEEATMPIKVVFNGTRGSVTAIDDIEADAEADAPATYFRINGTRATEPLAPGLYIKRQGEKVSKIIVR